MSKPNEELSQAAISELRKLSLFLDTEFDGAAKMSMEEIERELRALGANPNQPVPARIRHLLTRPAHVWVRNDLIENECADEVKFLILEIRELGAQQRYEEGLDLAIKATRIDPNYWRAKISLGVLLVILEQIDDGEKLFAEVLRDFPNNDKAIAASLHSLAWVKETRCRLNPEAAVLSEISQLYEEALELDRSAANTRASLFICHVKSNETDKKEKLLKESVLYEGFFDELRFELSVRSASARKVLVALPTQLRHLLTPINPLAVDGHVYEWGQ